MKHRLVSSALRLRTFAALAMLLTTLLGTTTTVAAQDDDMVSVSVAVWIDCLDTDTCNNVMYVPITATTLDGAFLDTCTVTVDPEGPLPGCSVLVPAGTTVVLTEDVSALPAGFAPDENPIIFDTADIGRAQYDAGFGNSLQGAGDPTAQTSVFIWTKENGQVVYDACYVLVDARDVACDENGNGYVFFSQVPVGTYTVRQVADLGPNRYVPDFTIEVTGIGDPGAPYPGMEMFSTEVISSSGPSTGPGASGSSAPSASSASTGPAGAVDPMAILPSIADVPGGLVETGRQTRVLPDVVANYTNPAETSQRFKTWGWQGNAVASFALPSGQEARSGEVNGVYVSIHQFRDAGAAKEALDFSLAEQAAGTDLDEISTDALGEYTRALYGPEDYGNETTVLTQQGGFLIRVSAAMLDGDPTADAVAVTQAILLNVTSGSTAGVPTEPASSGPPIDYFHVGCIPAKACLNATITLTTAEGEFVASGTCPDTDMIAPWMCGLRNVPRGIPVVITIDGIAPGYEVEQNPLYWDTAKEPSPAPSEGPGGMPTFTFVQTDTGASSGTAGPETAPDSSGSSGTGSLTVYFWSPRDNLPQPMGDCVELVGVTKQLCSNDYPDGRIEIVDIPAGTYEVCVSHLAPHYFWGRSHGPQSVTITPGSHETIQLDVYLKWNIDAGRQCGFD